MALAILDGTQTATTLSTILSSGQHITAHTVVSLGTQAITDMRSAVSGSVVSIPSLPAISGTVTANAGGDFASAIETVTDIGNASMAVAVHLYDDNGTFFGNSANPFSVSGTVTANAGQVVVDQGGDPVDPSNPFPIYGNVVIDSALPAGTNRIGVVTIGAGTVTIGAGTSQIGSVTASISGTVPISISSVTVGNSVTIGSLPALVAGTAQIGSVTASISNSVVTFYPMQGTTVTNSNFTSTTASTSLVSAVAGREVLTVFNEGAGNLHISPGATATTISYQVRLSAGDYWECPQGQLSLAHSAVFATAGTARVTEVS